MIAFPTHSACRHYESSYEVDELQQGTFIYAPLEGLEVRRRCATVERLNQNPTARMFRWQGRSKEGQRKVSQRN
ncbi:MAG: hypothetical protein HC925_07095 [Coleofasciculaceae cyanobacterium SM2_3_26]|nr:hypothetical protein [Coleofasciculaceae cyanobacterium SM2_3_26]